MADDLDKEFAALLAGGLPNLTEHDLLREDFILKTTGKLDPLAGKAAGMRGTTTYTDFSTSQDQQRTAAEELDDKTLKRDRGNAVEKAFDAIKRNNPGSGTEENQKTGKSNPDELNRDFSC